MDKIIKLKSAESLLDNIEIYEKELGITEYNNKVVGSDKLRKVLENMEIEPEEIDSLLCKCYIVYDAFTDKFKYRTVNNWDIVSFRTYTLDDAKMLVEKLNDLISEKTIEDLSMEALV